MLWNLFFDPVQKNNRKHSMNERGRDLYAREKAYDAFNPRVSLSFSALIAKSFPHENEMKPSGETNVHVSCLSIRPGGMRSLLLFFPWSKNLFLAVNKWLNFAESLAKWV